MSEFTMQLKLDNAAFDDPEELPRILRYVAGAVRVEADEYGKTAPIFDANGNNVGRYYLELDADDED